jgi:hypothetical protein
MLTGSAGAQEAGLAETGCELHVWPGDSLMSVYYGWLHGSVVNGQIMGRPGYPRVPPNSIDSAAQSAILAEMEPQRLLAQPGHRLVVHGEALPSRTIRANAGRLADSASACYSELVVDDVVLQQDGISGSFLKTLFHYRDFGADAQPRRSFATWSQTRLTIFPPRQPDQLEAALAELRQAYRRNLTQFSAAATRPPRHH